MAAYVVAEIDIADPIAYKAFQAMTPGSLARHGGHYLARCGHTETLEGAPTKRVVIVEFANMEIARRWYFSAEYTAARAFREQCATTRLFIVEGVREIERQASSFHQNKF